MGQRLQTLSMSGVLTVGSSHTEPALLFAYHCIIVRTVFFELMKGQNTLLTQIGHSSYINND